MVKILATVTGSISFSQKGDKGESGDTPYVTKTVVDYAITSSVSEAKKWTSTAPDASAAANKGKFLWTRTTYTWSNDKTTENITYTYIGKDGKDGASVTIKGSKDNTSQLPTSGNTLGDGYIIDGYLWVYTGTSKTDSTHAKGFERVSKFQGDPGVSATQYYIHTAWMKDSKGTGFTTTAGGGQYDYFGVLVDTNPNAPSAAGDWVKYDWSYVKGKKGDTGNGIKSTEVTYQIGSSGTTPPTDGVWDTKIPNITDEKPYLWTRTIFKYTNGSSSDPSFSVATRGTKGALMRQHNGFESGKYKYLSGSGAEAYVDVVCINGKWWQCIVTYPTETDSPNLSDGHWKEMNNYKSIATYLLLAENATINMLGTNQINLYNPTSGGKMYGSFRVVDDIDKWSLWLGGETGDSASFAVTRGGAIKATAGRIGSFTITERKDATGFTFYSLYATHNSFGIIPACDLELNYNGIHVWSGNNTVTNYAQVDIGYNGGLDGNNNITWFNGAINIKGSAASGGNSDAIAIYTNINPKDGYRSYALWANQGDVFLNAGAFIGALRPNVTTKSYSTTLSENECYIICTNTSSITLTLPSNPRSGQLYFVYQANAYVGFSSTSAHPIIVRGQDYPSGKTSWYSNTKNQLSIFTYGSDRRWYVAYMNG